MDRRCFTVQVSREAQMLIPSTSTEEAVGTGPCFYLSSSSSVVTKAKEELFGALTDMFSSCTRLQGRISRQSCPEAPSGQWHDVKSLPASPVDYPTLCQNICCLQFLRNMPVRQNPVYRGRTSTRARISSKSRGTWPGQIPNTSEKSCHMERDRK